MSCKTKILIWSVVFLLFVGGGTGIYFYETLLTVHPPIYPRPAQSVWTNQHWSQDQSQWFHHADQGTQTFGIPYEWFIALEQPGLFLGTPPKFSDSNYLDRFGFIPGVSETGSNDLPVGFAEGLEMPAPNGGVWSNPRDGKSFHSVGLTCAACHTGRFSYRDPKTGLLTAVYVDGGSALTNLGDLRTALGLSLAYLQYYPGRFDRFAEQILGDHAPKEARRALRAQLKTALDSLLIIAKADARVAKLGSIEEGFGRIDALTRIGNTVFGVDLHMTKTDNYLPYTAPVHYPHIWSASWFEWVQYDGSIEQPMVRNAGESLGVSAAVDLLNETGGLFTSSVRVDELYKMEQLLAGPTVKDPSRLAFGGLDSPKWADTPLPAIDPVLASHGAELYQKYCQGCHLPPVDSEAFWQVPEWKTGSKAGDRFLDLKMIPIAEIGTDPAQADGLTNRTVVAPPSLGLRNYNLTDPDSAKQQFSDPATRDFGRYAYGYALRDVVTYTVKRWYDAQTPPVSPQMREEMDGNRPNGILAPPAYKARPLNGIWATPPFLHNGSVPTLYDLLSPVKDRPTEFQLGNRDFDPEKVGYRTDRIPGGFLFDTKLPGNHNSGHAFDNDRSVAGRIGPELTPDERKALVEYLKTL